MRRPSAWTIDCLFESSEGQAQLLLGLPSLAFTQSNPDSDSSQHGRQLQVPASRIPNHGWQSTYSFYHKSFLDFLDSPGRSGVAFPDITDERVTQWIWERFHRVWICAGPEVPIDEALLPTFCACFVDILWRQLDQANWKPPILHQDVLSQCNPAAWYTGSTFLPVFAESITRQLFTKVMYILVHTQCRFGRPCLAGCKRWRKAILELPSSMWSRWSGHALLLDRFCIKRLKYI
ncbi:hypothetical protein NMY22_g6194 [Coprinellus aureogranulatus]|nr:hypothetical protein NMY22_g6194 [Coprinellus aureogranulatus]